MYLKSLKVRLEKNISTKLVYLVKIIIKTFLTIKLAIED